MRKYSEHCKTPSHKANLAVPAMTGIYIQGHHASSQSQEREALLLKATGAFSQTSGHLLATQHATGCGPAIVTKPLSYFH